MEIDSSFEQRTISMANGLVRAGNPKGDMFETKLFTFSGAERDEIMNKLTALMNEKNLDGILLSDPDKFYIRIREQIFPMQSNIPIKCRSFFSQGLEQNQQ